LTQQLIERVKTAGYEALILTVDSQVSGNREWNHKSGYTIPFTFNRYNITDVLMHPRWLASVLGRYLVTTGFPTYQNYPAHLKTKITAKPMAGAMMKAAAVTWDDVRLLRQWWSGPLIVKGILRKEDAIRAADSGVDGIVVSNHGGRNFDTTIASIDALPPIVDAVGNRITVMVDSGFRRGSDVLRALALGAKAVLLGRSILYGTATAGEAGAARAIDIFREEIHRGLGLLGCTSAAELNRDYVTMPLAYT
jgi:(S)-mandelate dehydrogenase